MQIIKRINESRGAGRVSDYKPWLYVNEVPSKGRFQRVYSHLTDRIHHLYYRILSSQFFPS